MLTDVVGKSRLTDAMLFFGRMIAKASPQRGSRPMLIPLDGDTR